MKMSVERTANNGDRRGENHVIILVRESRLNLEIILLIQARPLQQLWFPWLHRPILHPILSRRSSRGAGILATRGLSSNHVLSFPTEDISQYNNVLVVTIIIVLL